MTTNNGYFDLQLNGYKGVDFNADNLSAERCHWACEQLRADAVSAALATLTTDAVDRLIARLARLAELRRRDSLVREVLCGIHVEGPFLNETAGYIGAHPPEHARPADPEIAKRLVDAAEGAVRIITLAPERDPGFKTTRFLAERGITVSAGHCDPSLDQLRGAIDAGLSMFTHLGNGCPMMLHRHDNVIQRVLSVASRLWVCFIGDGVHVPYPTLANFLKCTGLERAVVVSDATSAGGLGPGRYTLGHQTIEVGGDLVAWAPDRSHFVGATATLPQVAERMMREMKLSAAEIDLLTKINPRRAISPSGQ
jgi:N-acetylglucosamine-6-phosphate deacetylase